MEGKKDQEWFRQYEEEKEEGQKSGSTDIINLVSLAISSVASCKNRHSD